MLMAVKWRSAATAPRCFARFVRLKGLTNKRDIRVSTANGRMVLTVTDDDLVRVNMGRPRHEDLPLCRFANKRKDLYYARRRANNLMWRNCRWKSALRDSNSMMSILRR